MKNGILTPQDVRARGFEVLKKGLGVTGALKFMHQYDRGEGDYSKQRHALVDGLDLATIMDRLRHPSKRRDR